jgi:phosphoglycolate phosphatase-like HAD superfamily hydrolase
MDTSELAFDVFSPAITCNSKTYDVPPDPRVASSICEAWALRPSEVLFVVVGGGEDDLRCGHEAGCKTCFVGGHLEGKRLRVLFCSHFKFIIVSWSCLRVLAGSSMVDYAISSLHELIGVVSSKRA